MRRIEIPRGHEPTGGAGARLRTPAITSPSRSWPPAKPRRHATAPPLVRYGAMRNGKRMRRPKQAGQWGVVEARSPEGFGDAAPLWLAYWMELDAPGRVSIEIDPDRDRNITPAAWGRARRAFGVPLTIRVLDEETARRVRRAVPSRVTVLVVPDEPTLKKMATICDDLPDDDLDLVPFPTPRARC